MTENELLSAADIIITETAHDKNSGGRLGSLFKSIIQFFSNKVTIVEDSFGNFTQEFAGLLEQEISDRENEDNRRLFLCNLDVFIPLESSFYTLQTAIEAVTGSTALSGRIIPGFEIRFKSSASVVLSFIYNGGDKYDTFSWKSNIVDIEKTARIAGDNALQATIENLSGEIGSESLARAAGDNALQASIDQEISDRQTAIQGVEQTVNSNTEEIENEITNRAQTVNALRDELLSKTIGSIETGAEEKPAEGVSRRYRFTNDGNCYLTDVLNGLTSDAMSIPFAVSKDDELSVIKYGENYIYRYFPIGGLYATKEQINDINSAIGNISSALDEILLIGGSI